MKKKYHSWMFACLFFTVEALTAQTKSDLSDTDAILVNGGFESGAPADFGALTGWDVYGNLGAQPVGFTRTKIGPGPSYFPNEGVRMAIFSAGNNDFGGALSQAFATLPGATYLVKLKMGIVTEAAGRRQALQVSVADNSGASILSRVETIVSSGKGTRWMDFTASFVAAGTQTRLILSDLSEFFPINQSYNTDLLIDGVSVTVQKPGSNPPIANSQIVSVTQDGFVPITLVVQDQDPGNVLTYRIKSGPLHGTIGGTPPNIVYTPNSGFSGADEFEFVLTGGSKESQTARVLINVIKKTSKFDQWMGTFGASGSLDTNPDKDSIVNGTEYVLGTNPVKKTGSNFLPKSRSVNQDPDGDGKKSRYLLFSYRRTQASASDPDVATLVEWRATAKDSWRNVANEKGVIVKTLNNRYTGGVDLVNVYVPRSITKSSKFSTRLRVVSKQ